MTSPIPPDAAATPSFLYGTAWKEERTAGLVSQALQAGFTGIDTANQRKHYYEAAVGSAIGQAISMGQVKRTDLFLQTKFTYQAGQDHRLPYDPQAPLSTQVQQSFDSSLTHLKTDYIDSYVLHGPSMRLRLSASDEEVWRAMEALHAGGLVRHLGVSNISRQQLEALWHLAEVKPTFVQNRCYAQLGWDHPVRQFCAEHNITYQGFSLLTANMHILGDPRLQQIAARVEKTPAQVVFHFCQQVGMLPLTGTSDPAHMQQDLDWDSFALTPEEVSGIERMGLQR